MSEKKENIRNIFIASSFKEFKDLRKKLVEKINKSFNYKAIDLDDNITDSRNTTQRSLEYVEEADYIVLLIGDNYGEITYKEYKKALELNKNILVYTKISLIPEIIDNIDDKNMINFLYEIRNNHTANEKLLSENQSIDYISSEILNHIYHNHNEYMKKKLIIKTKTNIENKLIRKQSILSRNIELEMSYQFFKSFKKNINSKLLFITGNPGVGKSIFLTDFFNIIDSDNIFNAFIYFIPINTTVNEILNAIYGYLYSYIHDEFKVHGLNDNILNTIHPNLTESDKINELFNIYSNCVKNNTLKPFILLIDNIDEIEVQDELLKKIILPTFGINFIISARKNDAIDFFKKQKLNNDFFDIYGNIEDNFTLRLSNFDEKITYDYINNNLDFRLNQNRLNNLILSKSNGLPLYLKYVVDNINKRIEENPDLNIDKVIEYLDSLPNELNDYYNQIFSELNNEELNILNILFWFNEPINLSELQIYCKTTNLEDFLKRKIFFLLEISNNEFIQISHFSIREALFNKHKINKNILTAYKITKEDIYTWLYTQDYIFKNFTIKNNFINLFSNISVYSNKNILFEKLTEIIIINLENNVGNKFIDLFYRYTKNRIFSENIKIDKLNHNSKFMDIFKKFEISKELELMVNKFYTQLDIDKIHDYPQILKLYTLSIITKQNYYSAKLLNKIISWKYIKLYNNFLEMQDIEIYNQIDFTLLKDFIAKKIKLTNLKFKKDIKLYDDSTLTYLVIDEKNNLEKSLLNNIKKMHQNKRSRVYNELVQRIFPYIDNSPNINLLKEFRKMIIYDIIFREKKKDKNFIFKYSILKKYNLDELFLKLDFKIALFEIKEYKPINYALPYEFKEILFKLKALIKIYYKKGIQQILNTSNKNHFVYFIYFLKEQDLKIYLDYCKENLDKPTLLEIVSLLVNFSKNYKLLNELKEIIIEKSEKIVYKLLHLMRIYYKTKDVENFNNLFPKIIKYATENVEKSYIMKISGNLESLSYDDEIINLYSRYIKDTSFIPNSILNIENIDTKIVFEYLDNLKLNGLEEFNGFLEKCILKSENLNLCKELILKYENSYSREINLNVYLLLKIDINKFLIEIKKSTIKNQIDFLTHNISYLAKKCQNNEVDSFNFFSYLNELIIITDDKEFTGLMLEKVMNHKYIIKFYKKNLDKLNALKYKYKNEVDINNMIYILIMLAEEHENKYIEVFDHSWFKNDLSNRFIIIMIVKSFTDFNLGLEFVNKIKNDFLKFRAQFLLSLNFKEQNLSSKEYFNYLYESSRNNRDTENMFENIIRYTLNEYFEDNNNQHLLNTIFFNDKNSMCSNILKYLNILEYDKNENCGLEKFIMNINDKKLFMTNYLKYFYFEDFCDEKKFSSNNIIEILSILLDQYKDAEKNGNEIKYNKYEKIFESIKNQLINSELFEFINNLFNKKFERLTLENLFENLNYRALNDEEFKIDSILTNYEMFLIHINSIYDDYKKAQNDDDLIKEQDCLNKFNLIKNEIIENTKYFEKITSISSIENKLQIKLTNVNLFKPI